MITPKNMSKRVFGIGIIISGLLVLSIALILGLRFPAYVYTKAVQTQCILEPSHSQYIVWINDSYRDKTNRIYYWVITNKDEFLHQGHLPKTRHPDIWLDIHMALANKSINQVVNEKLWAQVVQKGPYVYRERETKIDPTFSSNVVHFYFWYRQTFDAESTRAECGDTCTEHDELTVVNQVFLKILSELHGETNFALTQTPRVISKTMSTVSSLTGNIEETTHTFGRLLDNSLDRWSEQLNYPQGYSNLGFGNWIFEGDISYKKEIRDNRSSTDFSLVEIKGLMDALSNAELLGATHKVLSNASFPDKCVMPSAENFAAGDSSAGLQFTGDNADTCRLTSCLYRFKKHLSRIKNLTIFTPDLAESINCISKYLCTNVSGSCLSFPQDNNTIRLAYAQAVHDYIFLHLVHFVFHSTVISKKDDIVVSRRQRDLALGFYLNESSNFHSFEGNFVPGILEHTDSIKNPLWYILRKKASLYNCYDTVEAETNFMWKAYNGMDFSPISLFPNTSNSERKIYSRRRNIPPQRELEACASYSLPQNDYDFFHSEIMRKWSYFYDGETDVRGVGVLQLTVNRSSVVSEDFTNDNGLQDMTSWNKYLSWVCLPHFLWANSSFSIKFDMKPSTSKHSSKIFFEPITGEAWSGAFRYQHNAGVRDRYFNAIRSSPLSISYTDSPIPVYWVEKSFIYNDVGKDYYKRKFGQLMSISCGGLIGLGVVASLIILSGFLAATVKLKGGRISPLIEDDDNREHNSVLF